MRGEILIGPARLVGCQHIGRFTEAEENAVCVPLLSGSSYLYMKFAVLMLCVGGCGVFVRCARSVCRRVVVRSVRRVGCAV